MARTSLLLCGLLGLLLAAALGVVPLDRPLHPGPVHAVAEMRANLARQPQVWLNRPLVLRGVAIVIGGCVAPTGPPLLCAHPQAVLSDADPASTVAPLPLAGAGPDPVLATMRRVPLLGSLLPAPPVVLWGKVTTYLVQLRAERGERCGAAACYEAVLLDAAL